MARNDEPEPLTKEETANLAYAAFMTLNACVLTLMRRRPGRDVPGLPGLFALVLMLVYAGLANDEATLIYIAVWFAGVVQMKFETDRAKDTFDWGEPAFAMRLLRTKDHARAIRAEPFICLLGGALLCTVSEPLGLLISFTFVSLTAVNVMQFHAVNEARKKADNARIRAKAYQEMMKDREEY